MDGQPVNSMFCSELQVGGFHSRAQSCTGLQLVKENLSSQGSRGACLVCPGPASGAKSRFQSLGCLADELWSQQDHTALSRSAETRGSPPGRWAGRGRDLSGWWSAFLERGPGAPGSTSRRVGCSLHSLPLSRAHPLRDPGPSLSLPLFLWRSPEMLQRLTGQRCEGHHGGCPGKAGSVSPCPECG